MVREQGTESWAVPWDINPRYFLILEYTIPGRNLPIISLSPLFHLSLFSVWMVTVSHKKMPLDNPFVTNIAWIYTHYLTISTRSFLSLSCLYQYLGKSLQICNWWFVSAPESEWNKLLINGLTLGKGDISPEELYRVIKKRIERVLIRTVSFL